uniref:WD domain-containing protein, G-beta repeat-containing protein n=1 Tax=Candidatus Kentrum sp. DK TaxID=2126562 RepID=A0A450SC78_9GAMM|nr:MAG: WD domain-containing protein, G-beta repeat-containing protein [Candidatus Kentron sp. DK]
MANGQEIRTFQGYFDWVYSVAFAPDGRTALSGSRDKTLTLWDVASGEEIQTLRGHSNFVVSVAFSPDGQRAASGDVDGMMILWGEE